MSEQNTNNQLQNILDNLLAEKQALRRTIGDLLEANITLKTALVLLEQKIEHLNKEKTEEKKDVA